MFKKTLLLELVLISIITIPAFFSLLNGNYFTMHDDQHIVRLFLLDQGIRQGSFYPRWVDGLGFGFGYPLFNFYPPFIYYVAELFHLIGFSLVTSIKLMVITGFIGAGMGLYLFAKNVMGKAAATVSTVLYTYFFYHAVTVYVRGAFAEFFTFAIVPFVFLFLYKLYKKPSTSSSIGLGLSLGALVLTHPLIAFPSIIYIGFFIVYFVILNRVSNPVLILSKNNRFMISTLLGLLSGLGLSSFFWLPSMIERKFTMVDSILLKELANYKIHFISLGQLWYSPWGYGGSVEGTGDGFTFQLGKMHILFFILSIILFAIYWLKTKKFDAFSKNYLFFVFLFLFSIFMTLPSSAFIWNNIQFLWYLQFPWRFLTFTAIFLSLSGGFVLFFASHIDKKRLNKEWILLCLALGITSIVIFKYQQYFKPQTYLKTTDAKRTSDEEIKWRVSKSSFEFVPKGVRIKKSNLGTTILDIDKVNISDKPFREVPLVEVKVVKNEFAKKWFVVNTKNPGSFQLNTFNFPGWKASVNGKQVQIQDNNPYKLITINVPKDVSSVEFYFDTTPIRTIGTTVSILTVLVILGYSLLTRVRRGE